MSYRVDWFKPGRPVAGTVYVKACEHTLFWVDANGWANCRDCSHQWPVNPNRVD